MAAVITDFGSDFGSDSSRSHYHRSRKMRAGSAHERSPAASPYRQTSQSRVERPPSSPRSVPVAAGTPPPSTPSRAVEQEVGDNVVETETETVVKTEQPPSPPLSSSPNPGSFTRNRFTSQENFPVSSTSTRQYPHTEDAAASNKPPITLVKPEPEFSGPSSLDDVKGYAGDTIKVRDLAHIQSFATEDFLLRGKSGRRRAADDPALKYEISGMPITDIIEMVAGLLTKITTTNDQQHETLNRSLPSGEHSLNLSGLSSSVLAFHGKNVPSITILSYLSRIHKYCPTTYEVFLSLLVYFDRMTERVNAAPMQALRRESMDLDNSRPSTGYSADGSDLADSSSSGSGVGEEDKPYTHTEPSPVMPSFPLSHFFVVDSFNIHRLVIAGVTCASKFFSDVFYTNSRYAKVGGLPLPELNHLELQFLLLNDFRLSVPVEELEAYGTMLVEFYAREVIAQRDAGPPYAP
ncbi:PHO85 cyclin [Lachnellula occidentalis]|uniref:PHO85 cyclin n=1 Tax=Lachnellula occidentalis TaxID=215460 RepID=A0A8H8RTT6_9HELO|nr:PHO85 cyclin [Lachnellula occidentalis]